MGPGSHLYIEPRGNKVSLNADFITLETYLVHIMYKEKQITSVSYMGHNVKQCKMFAI